MVLPVFRQTKALFPAFPMCIYLSDHEGYSYIPFRLIGSPDFQIAKSQGLPSVSSSLNVTFSMHNAIWQNIAICYNIPLQIFCLDRQSCQEFPLVHQKYIRVFSPKIVNKTITQLSRWPYRFFVFDWSFSSSLFFLFLCTLVLILNRYFLFKLRTLFTILS